MGSERDVQKSITLEPALGQCQGLFTCYDHIFISQGHVIMFCDAKSFNVSLFAGNPHQEGHKDGHKKNQALFRSPHGIALYGGHLLICDQDSHAIRGICSDIVSTVAGTGIQGWKDGAMSAAQFDSPSQIVAFHGRLFIGESQRIRIISCATGTVSTLRDQGNPEWPILRPGSLATSYNYLYVADRQSGSVFSISKDQRVARLQMKSHSADTSLLATDDGGLLLFQPQQHGLISIAPGGHCKKLIKSNSQSLGLAWGPNDSLLFFGKGKTASFKYWGNYATPNVTFPHAESFDRFQSLNELRKHDIYNDMSFVHTPTGRRFRLNSSVLALSFSPDFSPAAFVENLQRASADMSATPVDTFLTLLHGAALEKWRLLDPLTLAQVLRCAMAVKVPPKQLWKYLCAHLWRALSTLNAEELIALAAKVQQTCSHDAHLLQMICAKIAAVSVPDSFFSGNEDENKHKLAHYIFADSHYALPDDAALAENQEDIQASLIALLQFVVPVAAPMQNDPALLAQVERNRRTWNMPTAILWIGNSTGLWIHDWLLVARWPFFAKLTLIPGSSVRPHRYALSASFPRALLESCVRYAYTGTLALSNMGALSLDDCFFAFAQGLFDLSESTLFRHHFWLDFALCLKSCILTNITIENSINVLKLGPRLGSLGELRSTLRFIRNNWDEIMSDTKRAQELRQVDSEWLELATEGEENAESDCDD